MTTEEIIVQAQESGWVRRPDLDYECISMSGPNYGKDVKREIWVKDGKQVCTEDLEYALRTSDPLAAGAQPAAPATQEPTPHPEGAATFKIGDLVCATKTLFWEATDELPAQDFCNVGDTLEVRNVAGFWPYSVAHPNREKGAMFGVSADEIEPLTKLPAPATPPSITDAAKEIIAYIESNSIVAWVDRDSPLPRLESILSRLLGAQAGEMKRFREEVERLLPLAYETRPGLEIGPVTWQQCYQDALAKMYAIQDERDASRSELTQLRQDAKRLHVEVERYIVALTIAMEHVAGNGTEFGIVETQQRVKAAMQPSEEPA